MVVLGKIPVLRWKSLSRTSDHLSEELCIKLARALKVSEDKIQELVRDETKKVWYKKWRTVSRPNRFLALSLAKAMKEIGEEDISLDIKDALEFEEEY